MKERRWREVLFGDYNPGGRLVETWPKSLDQLPPMMDYNIRDGKHLHVLQGRAALSVWLRLELHDVQVLKSADERSAHWRRTAR